MDTDTPDISASGARSASVPEVHNSAVDEAAALQGGCAQLHLPSGRMCTLRNGHGGSCEFTPPELVETELAKNKAAEGW
jgi:hypothetical protein